MYIYSQQMYDPASQPVYYECSWDVSPGSLYPYKLLDTSCKWMVLLNCVLTDGVLTDSSLRTFCDTRGIDVLDAPSHGPAWKKNAVIFLIIKL